MGFVQVVNRREREIHAPRETRRTREGSAGTPSLARACISPARLSLAESRDYSQSKICQNEIIMSDSSQFIQSQENLLV